MYRGQNPSIGPVGHGGRPCDRSTPIIEVNTLESAATSAAPGVARSLPPGFEAMVWAEAEGRATPEQIEVLKSHLGQWQTMLWILLDRAEDALESVSRMRGAERNQVIADHQLDFERLDAALTRLVGPPTGRQA